MKEEKKSTVYFLVGVPGSGKSTWANKSGLPVLSSDKVRLEKRNGGNCSNIPPAQEVFRLLDERANERLAIGDFFVFDASNIEVYFRRKRLNEWKNKYHARICGIVCLVPKHEVLKRNRERLDTVPEVIVEKIWDEFVRDPIDTSKDLFDELSVVDEFGFVRSVYRRSCEYDLHNKTPDIILSPVEFRQK